ncbi:MAG: right-handed parallel beta-helix repeat-containing protein [Bacteroidales bacterium]|jgi:hypothetical protein|nr:right-handed parallel beta-helix repeat-containing protein [Bacteroidales bacterium]
MKKKCNFITVVLISILFVLPHLAIASTYYVDATSGSNDNNGRTEETAWRTVSKINGYSFSPGDSILFKRGETWNEQLLIPSSGSASGGTITFAAYGSGDKPVFDGTGFSLELYHGMIRGSNMSYVKIKNLRVQNVGIGNALNNSGIGFYGSSNIMVQNCETYNTEGAGIKFNNGMNITVDSCEVERSCVDSREESISFNNVTGFLVSNNYVHHDGTGDIYGGLGIDAKGGCHNGIIERNTLTALNPNAIYVDGYASEGTGNIIIRYNLVYSTSGPGIMIASEAGGPVDNVLIHHNIIISAARGGIAFHDKFSDYGNITNIKIYNNTLFQNGTKGVNYWGGIRIFDPLIVSLDFRNNIFADAHNFQIGYHLDKLPSGITSDYNVIRGENSKVTGGFTPLKGANDITITGEPLFVDASIMDFHLETGSPAINAGNNAVWQGIPNISDYDSVHITDESGNIVAPDDTVSCGAFEFEAEVVIPNDSTVNETQNQIVQPRLVVYPNPSNANMNVLFNEPIESIGIFSLGGNLLYHKKTSNKKITLNLEELPPGFYLLKATTKGQRSYAQRIFLL